MVVFPGSNADAEMLRTLRDVCGAPTTVAWHTDVALPAGTDLVALPGGFAFGDYLRCGAIAKVSPIVGAIRAHAGRGGYVLGVCNGFQVLTETGLLPGALTRNVSQRFECGDWYVKTTAEGPFTPRDGRGVEAAHRARRGALPGRREDAPPARGRGAHRPAVLRRATARSTSARTRTGASTPSRASTAGRARTSSA